MRPFLGAGDGNLIVYNHSKVSTTSGLRAYPAVWRLLARKCKDEGLAGNGWASRSTLIRAIGATFDLGKELDSPQGVFLPSVPSSQEPKEPEK